jgi:oxygen-dependent protoporphyrinogen oxidase
MTENGQRVDIAIVGGGISALALAWRLRQRAPELRTVVLEAGERAGGKVRSECVITTAGSFLVETGPDSLLTQKPEALRLVDELGMSDQLVPIATGLPTAILHRGKPELMPRGMRLIVPTELKPFLRSPLLSPAEKARALRDLRGPRKQGDGDESIADFVRRHFGREMVTQLAEPILAGIHNGDPERLSLCATFPQLEQLERKSGSLIRGMRAAKPGQSAPFVALRDGMGTLADELISRLGETISTNSKVTEIERRDDEFVLTLGERQIVAKKLVLTTPAAETAALCDEIAPKSAEILRQFSTNHAGSISLAVRTEAVMRPLPGYGLVIPRTERRAINAITVASRKFAGRAPDGWTLLRLFFGGARSPQTMALDDSTLLNTVRQELRDLLGITEAPFFWRITRWPAGNPQYEVGHLDRVSALEASLPSGLLVIGSAYRGVGIPDLVRAADNAAAMLIEIDAVPR